MQSKTILRYVFFGTAFRYLQDASQSTTVHGDFLILWNIDQFLSTLDELNLVVTKRASYKLREVREHLSKTDPAHLLTSQEAKDLSTIMTDLRKTLDAELEGNIAYIVTDKRIDVQKLLSGVGSLMSPGVFDSLPEVAKHDFSEAGKCIAFERPTAAAFHVLRGTESVLRHYYKMIVRRNRSELLWGPMVASLKTRRSRISTALLSQLDYIRLEFRNPTQHPEKIYDIQEAQDIFGLCVEVVARMVYSTQWIRSSPRTPTSAPRV